MNSTGLGQQFPAGRAAVPAVLGPGARLSSVLVVDDRRADRELAVTVLGYAGYRALQASSGVAALEMARAELPDLIITDILMPGMNGYELVRELHDDPELRNVAVIFSTANYIEGEVRRLADACGVTHFLPKPCDPATIVKVVGEVLGLERRIVVPLRAEEFEREQRRLINDKFVEKINELEAVSAERQRLVGELLQAHEDERRRIAQELHDDPIQVVVAVGMRLAMLAQRLADPADRAAVLDLQVTVQGAIDRLRALVFALVPVELESQGLAVALKIYLEHLESEGGPRGTLNDHAAREPEPATRTLLYRLAQEALTNVQKYAGASTVDVTLEDHDGCHTIRVSDDGHGFDPREALQARPGHLGLASMQERVILAGGSLRLDSAVGSGATVEITLPDRLAGPRSAAGEAG